MRILNHLYRRAAEIKVAADKMRYRPAIGLEIHAQISSKSKMFSSAAFDDEAYVNSTVELFDMATPGTLPVLNRNCVLKGISASVLLNCTIAHHCRFERKHYFYADMPAGYQLTQQRNPIAHSGHFDYFVHSSEENFSSYRRRLRISRIQLEVDSGKTVHDLVNNRSLIDLNRAGVGLLEIVTEPELNSALEAYCFIEQLRIMLALNGICCGEMHKGQLRVDANISLAVEDSPTLGIRTEVKNLNSLKSICSAINYEISRQYEILNQSGEVLNETRTIDHKGHTVPMREKEIETDYRFMPEPNLPAVHIDPELIVIATRGINRRPTHLRYIEEYGFDPDSALRIARDERLSRFIDEILHENSFDAHFLLDWLKELKRICQNCNIDYPPIREKFASNFATILYLNRVERITRLTSIDLIRNYVNGTWKDTPLQTIEHENLWQIKELDQIRVIVDTVFDGHQELVAKAKAQPVMDQCVFTKGKKKLLSERGDGISYRVRKQSRQCDALYRFMPAFEGLINSAISDLYGNVLSEIAEFVQVEWDSSRSCSELPTGVVCCENVDGISLNHSLTELLGKEPICISAPIPPLYTVVDLIRKNKEPKCLILKRVECLPPQFIDSFISVLSDPDWDCKFVLLMTISADMGVVYSRCSRGSYTQLAIRRFEFPPPLMALNTFLNAVTFHPHSAVRVDGKLFDELRASFLERSFSIEQLKKMVRLAVLHFFTTTENLQVDVEECSSHIERYVLFMRLLCDLCNGLPLQPQSIYELHSELQSNANFFINHDGLFSEWKSVWLTWEVQQVKAAVNKLLPHVKELDDDLHTELQSLLLDLENLEARKSAMCEKMLINASGESPSGSNSGSKLSYSAMQQRLKEKMAITKKLDLFTSDRRRFVKLLTRAFRMVLKPFDAIDALRKALLRGGAFLSTLVTPCIVEQLESTLAGSNLHQRKVDLCVAYRTLQRMAVHKKSIPIAEWAHDFEEQIYSLKGVDASTRFYKCIADLELMGVIKAVSDNCITAVHLLQPPSTLVIDTH